MAQRKVSVLARVRDKIAYIAYFIESKGMPDTAKEFVDDCMQFFENLNNPKIKHRPCSNLVWNKKGYRCATFRKKFIVAFIDREDEIIICDFVPQKLVSSRI